MQSPPDPRQSPRRRQQRRLGPVVRQRLESLEERRQKSGAASGSRSATELGQHLPRVYAGVATVTDLTATSSSADTLFSRDDAGNAGGDLDCLSLDASDATGLEDSHAASEDGFDDAGSDGTISEEILPSDGIVSLKEDDDSKEGDQKQSEDAEAILSPGGEVAEFQDARSVLLPKPVVRKGELAAFVTQKWKRRLENNRSVLNLCRRISLMDQRKVND